MILLPILSPYYARGQEAVTEFHPLPRYTYYSDNVRYGDNAVATSGQAKRRTIRFFAIMVGSFPVAYLIATPIVVASTQNNWTLSQRVGLIAGVAGGAALTVALIDLIIDVIQGNKPLDELSP